MTDIVERATRVICRAVEAGSFLGDPAEAQRVLRTVISALEVPDRDMVDAAEALGLAPARGEAAAIWNAMAKNLKRRCGPLSSQDFAGPQPPDRLVPRRPRED